jgi:hypothetical protein
LLPLLTFESDPANQIVVPSRVTRWHPLVVQARDAFASGYKDGRGMPCPARKCINISVSVEQRARALSVLNALINALEKRGFNLVSGKHHVDVDMFGVSISFCVFEPTKRSPYVPTAQEVAAKKHNNYSYWPPYQYTPTGNLEIRSDSGFGGVIKDTARAPIEEQLNQAVVMMAKRAISILRSREEMERLRLLHVKQREEALAQKAIQDVEKQKLERLTSDAIRWQQAQTIRAYLCASEASLRDQAGLSTEQIEFLEWARAKADWLDPLVHRPDPILDQKIVIRY